MRPEHPKKIPWPCSGCGTKNTKRFNSFESNLASGLLPFHCRKCNRDRVRGEKQRQIYLARKYIKALKEKGAPSYSDRCQEHRNRRRARKAAVIIEPIRANFRALALVAWDHRCAYCRRTAAEAFAHRLSGADGDSYSAIRLELDHFVPLARGGAHTEYNLVPACRSCNSSKGDRDPFAFLHDRSASAGSFGGASAGSFGG